MTPERSWRKSSRSSDNGQCVEVSADLDAVRDSKNPAGPVLEIAPDRLGRFVAAIKGR